MPAPDAVCVLPVPSGGSLSGLATDDTAVDFSREADACEAKPAIADPILSYPDPLWMGAFGCFASLGAGSTTFFRVVSGTDSDFDAIANVI